MVTCREAAVKARASMDKATCAHRKPKNAKKPIFRTGTMLFRAGCVTFTLCGGCESSSMLFESVADQVKRKEQRACILFSLVILPSWF